MLLEIRYTTQYRYDPPINGGLTAVRLRPRSSPGVEVLTSQTRAKPGSVRRTYTDGWGTAVDMVEFDSVHDFAEFQMHAHVRTTAAEHLDTPPDPWEAYAYRNESVRTSFQAVAPLGWDFGGQPHLHWGSVETLLRWFPQRFQYQVGATDAATPIEKVIEQGAGVCQDFAHVMLALLRRWGWAARYVSGYFFSAETSTPRIEAEAMHAWVEVYRPGFGWIGLDATTGQPADDRYIPVGYGRDYDDVAPLRGVLVGTSRQEASGSLEIQQISAAQQ